MKYTLTPGQRLGSGATRVEAELATSVRQV